ncbi:hypothetical protein Lal_00044343 [Lupinus albus]|nr:hypothetical protein Lal_00044343 [Lupinus albus]
MITQVMRKNEEGGEQGEKHRRERRHEEDRLEGVKIRFPPLSGKTIRKAYLEWGAQNGASPLSATHTKKIRRLGGCIEFKEYALIWRFVPSSYQRDIRNKLQRLTQGSKSVDEIL